MAPMETRGQKREPVNSMAEFAINEATEKSIKLNLPTGAGGQPEAIKAALLDINVYGCGLDSGYLIPPGVVLDINIDASPFMADTGKEHKDPIKVTGSVRSCTMKTQGHYRMGIQFTKISEEDKNIISFFIAGNERRQAPRWDMTKK